MYFFNRIERPLLDLMDMFPDFLLCELYRLGGIPLGLCGFGLGLTCSCGLGRGFLGGDVA